MATQTFYVNIFPTTLLQEDIISFWGGKKTKYIREQLFPDSRFLQNKLG